jgi:hypothetical protein
MTTVICSCRACGAGARSAYSRRWRTVQEQFVDSPDRAVGDADVLVEEVMRERGYPVGDFGQQARVVSVDHADVAAEYHAAHEISLRNQRGEASTEQLREAMVRYRTLFAALLDDGPVVAPTPPRGGAPRSGPARPRPPVRNGARGRTAR